MNKYFISIVSIITTLFLSGCGSNSKADSPLVGGEGEASTLSIVYENTECDAARGIVSHYHIHAVDLKSNLPIENIPLSFSLINGVKEINGNKVQYGSGILYASGNKYSFRDDTVNFATTNVSEGDNLIIFPSRGRSDISYIGGWGITDISTNLSLAGEYLNIPSEVNSLTYIIGNEERLLGGEYGGIGELATAHIEIVDNETDENGYVQFDVVYDFALAGHTVSIEAHGNDRGRRVGVSSTISLRLDGDNFYANPVSVSNDGNLQYARMHLRIQPSCSGDVPLVDVPVNPRSFTVEPVESCRIDYDNTSTEADGYGNVYVAVLTDGNVTAAADCTVSWNGGPGSLYYEY